MNPSSVCQCVSVLLRCVSVCVCCCCSGFYTRCDSSGWTHTRKTLSLNEDNNVLSKVVRSCCVETLRLSSKCRLSGRAPGGGAGLPAAHRRCSRPVRASRRTGLVCRWALKCLLWLPDLPDPRGSASSRHQVSLSRLTCSRAASSPADMVLVLVLVSTGSVAAQGCRGDGNLRTAAASLSLQQVALEEVQRCRAQPPPQTGDGNLRTPA